MRKKFLLIIFVVLCTYICVAQDVANDNVSLEESYKSLSQKQTQLENNVQRLNKEAKGVSVKLESLTKDNENLHLLVDSLQDECKNLNTKQDSDKREVDKNIDKANDTIHSHQSTLKKHTIGGIFIAVALVIILALVLYFLLKRIKKGNESIYEISKAQDALKQAQSKLQEESVKLDNKMLELIEKQISTIQIPAASSEVDHSLALKVADEIVRIETNLSRMDNSIKGHKQLAKAVERIRDNFFANGYEIVDMLDKPYNEGMKVVANFVVDDTLAEGEQKITGITKPQVNYKGKMIQSAQITVSQNL